MADLASPTMQPAFTAAGGVIPDQPASDSTLEALAVDYCRLFLGPSGHLPPYQSVWTSGHFQDDATVAMQRELQTRGLPEATGMADHFGRQLTVMAATLEALASQPTATADQLNQTQQFFVQRINWAHRLCEQATARAQTDFYRSIMMMTKAFLVEEETDWCHPKHT